MLYTPAFFAMAFANFSVLVSFSGFFLFPLYISQRGGDHADIGVIMGAFGLASVLCRPVIADMVDRIGRKKSYTIGLVMMALAPLAYLPLRGSVHDYYAALFLVRILHGIAFAICITTAFTYIADMMPLDRLNEGIGIFGVSGLTGSAIGPLLGEWIIRHFGFEGLFLSAAGVSMVGFVAHLPVPDVYTRHSAAGKEESFLTVWKRGKHALISAIAFLFGFGLAASNGFVAPFANERMIPVISIYYVSYSTAAVLTRLVGGRIADNIGEERIIPLALLTMGAGLVATIFLGGNTVLALAGFLTGGGHGFLYPALNAFALRGESPGVRGKVTGIYTGSIDGGSFIGSLVLGYVGLWSGFPFIFILAGLAPVLGFFVYQFFCGRISHSRCAS